jgi:hypothetical protein
MHKGDPMGKADRHEEKARQKEKKSIVAACG